MKQILSLRMLAAAVAAAVIGVVSSSSDASAATALRNSCGNDSMCYSVPGGCGPGVGCQTAYCYMSACPSILGGDGICKFCQNES